MGTPKCMLVVMNQVLRSGAILYLECMAHEHFYHLQIRARLIPKINNRTRTIFRKTAGLMKRSR